MLPHMLYSACMLTEKSIENTNKFTSYSQFHSALHCAFQVVDMGDFRSNMKTIKSWSVSDISEPLDLGCGPDLEFKDSRGEWHHFSIIATREKIVFGSMCNTGFLESGYLERDGDGLQTSLEETLADLETYYNDGPQYVSRICCNERM